VTPWYTEYTERIRELGVADDGLDPKDAASVDAGPRLSLDEAVVLAEQLLGVAQSPA